MKIKSAQIVSRKGGASRPKTAALALAGCLAILLGFSSWSLAAAGNAKIANLKFSGPISEADRKSLGLEKPGAFSLQDIKAPYVLIEIMRTT
jgi:hypothetical protein